MKKLIILVLISLILGLLISLGFFSPYNCITAKNELKTNHFKKICINEPYIFLMIEEKMGDKYGIEVVDLSNIYQRRPINYFGIRLYNKIMTKGFIKYNGETIYIKYKNELDSLCSHQISI